MRKMSLKRELEEIAEVLTVMPDNMVEVSAPTQLVKVIEASCEEKIFTMIYCFKEWCKPCKRIAPTFVELAKNNPNVSFVKVDLEIPQMKPHFADIKTVPTFLFYKDGEEVARVDGANEKSSDREYLLTRFGEIYAEFCGEN